MISSANKRVDEPVYWALFGAGGMWSAIFAPAAILIVCFLIPLGVIDNTAAYAGMKSFCAGFLGRVFTLCMIALPIWCGMHRIHHCLHDMKVHCLGLKGLCYGLAAILSVVAVFLVCSF
ncbi:MAG: fumarate reductase subunit D [Candidatus Desulfovibrio kirbyi]|jgi:fumarate reductase subunit D|uniref:Fumarate reductase subunit D n=1 Tax=Candidatus Desulfovibrio kirbyi TaxID=2696086 RepID=A0A6L2R5I4_9BACT|nr:fumarate reductase subunit D [Desulfovibrio sp.]GFH62809.1 MAG: fumarate reductase subunit D [Candidatus Desulfovibrio kirbyi]